MVEYQNDCINTEHFAYLIYSKIICIGWSRILANNNYYYFSLLLWGILLKTLLLLMIHYILIFSGSNSRKMNIELSQTNLGTIRSLDNRGGMLQLQPQTQLRPKWALLKWLIMEMKKVSFILCIFVANYLASITLWTNTTGNTSQNRLKNWIPS